MMSRASRFSVAREKGIPLSVISAENRFPTDLFCKFPLMKRWGVYLQFMLVMVLNHSLAMAGVFQNNTRQHDTIALTWTLLPGEPAPFVLVVDSAEVLTPETVVIDTLWKQLKEKDDSVSWPVVDLMRTHLRPGSVPAVVINENKLMKVEGIYIPLKIIAFHTPNGTYEVNGDWNRFLWSPASGTHFQIMQDQPRGNTYSWIAVKINGKWGIYDAYTGWRAYPQYDSVKWIENEGQTQAMESYTMIELRKGDEVIYLEP